jgi:hypothetical protein
VLLLAFSGFACAAEQATDAPTVSATKAATGAGIEAPHGSSVQASASTSPTGNAEQYRLSCRIQTHIFKEEMSKAEVKDFTARMTYRVQSNLNGGGNKNLGDILDDLGVPAYTSLCGW